MARKFLAQMLLGLEYLHSNSIIHRDIKGANCLLFPPPTSVSRAGAGATGATDDSDLMVKLADFGASRMFEHGFGEVQGAGMETVSVKNESNAQSSGGPQGTANWMAPEVILNEKPGRGADIWSLGATTIELLTGRAPYAGLPQVRSGRAFFDALPGSAAVDDGVCTLHLEGRRGGEGVGSG